jgi:uncharacterized LabA/DUF88 family protein
LDRLVGFIDFGFLKAGAANVLGVKPRELAPRALGVVTWLQSLDANYSLLRAYWYDGAYDPRHARHTSQRTYFDGIAAVPGIQLRLGHLRETTPKWQYPIRAALKRCGVDLAEFETYYEFRPQLSQKGVDTRITLDLVRLAQRHAYDVGVLVAGDRDLAEAVRAAQDEGRRIVVAVPAGAGLATELKQLADDVIQLTAGDLGTMFSTGQQGSVSATAASHRPGTPRRRRRSRCRGSGRHIRRAGSRCSARSWARTVAAMPRPADACL